MLAVMMLGTWVPTTTANAGNGYVGLIQTWRAEQQLQKRLDARFKALEAEAAGLPTVNQSQWCQPAEAGECCSQRRK